MAWAKAAGRRAQVWAGPRLTAGRQLRRALQQLGQAGWPRQKTGGRRRRGAEALDVPPQLSAGRPLTSGGACEMLRGALTPRSASGWAPAAGRAPEQGRA